MRTAHSNRERVLYALTQAGFTLDDAQKLRRISLTLHSWHELECGDGNGSADWAIQRDENTGIPYMVTYFGPGKPSKRRVADREKGALRRLASIMANHPTLSHYVQGDPRGVALYILRPGDVPEGKDASQYYQRGIAVY